MSKTFKDGPGSKPNRGAGRGRSRRRDISVRAIRRDPPDLHKLSRALIQLAIAEAEAEAGQAINESRPPAEPSDGESND